MARHGYITFRWQFDHRHANVPYWSGPGGITPPPGSNNGYPTEYACNNGSPSAMIAGNAPAIGIVNYTEIKLSKRDFLSLRPIDILDDRKGERTGYATTYESWTAGITHRFSDLFSVRPEIRYEYAFSAKPYDNGTRNSQLMFAVDAIVRF